MSTPRLPTYVRHQIDRQGQRMQTAFPAKVLSYSASAGTVKLEPQFIEAWVTRDGERHQETVERSEYVYIDNVPVCFPHFMSWDIPANTFGLCICTKYSLDLWRQQLQRIDPGDLRRFTMSGATFHPVVMGRSPSVAQDFVALEQKVKTALGKIQAAFDSHAHASFGTAPTAVPTTIPIGTDPTWDTDVGSSKVKAEV